MPDVTSSPLVRPVEYDPESGAYRARYDWASPVPLTTAIVEVIAEVDEVDSRDVSRVAAGVDPEALDALFAPSPIAESRREGEVSFVVGAHRVTVRGTGELEVRPTSTG